MSHNEMREQIMTALAEGDRTFEQMSKVLGIDVTQSFKDKDSIYGVFELLDSEGSLDVAKNHNGEVIFTLKKHKYD